MFWIFSLGSENRWLRTWNSKRNGIRILICSRVIIFTYEDFVNSDQNASLFRQTLRSILVFESFFVRAVSTITGIFETCLLRNNTCSLFPVYACLYVNQKNSKFPILRKITSISQQGYSNKKPFIKNIKFILFFNFYSRECHKDK